MSLLKADRSAFPALLSVKLKEFYIMASQTVIILGMLAALLALSAARPEEAYSTQYDDFDIDQVLANRRLLENYFKCLVDRGPCTKEALELKQTLPDALQSKCSKCNDKQKEKADKVARHILDKEPAMWAEVKVKYDPDGKWEAAYGQEAREHGYKI